MIKKKTDKKIKNNVNKKYKINYNTEKRYKKFISKLLIPFSLVYILVYAIVKYKFRKSKVICKKTICIDSLINGGVNKVQFCSDVCNAFINEGKKVCFITIDEKRKLKRNFIVPKDHYFLFNQSEVGKKSLLLCKKADVFVVDERENVEKNDYDVAICDECFFDETIKKDCNIIVFDENCFIGNGYVKPAGKLKYRLKSLKKADFIIIVDEKKDRIEHQKDFLSKFIDRNRILTASSVCNNSYDKSLNYIAFAKKVNSEIFFRIVKEQGFNVKKNLVFSRSKKNNNKFLDFLKLQFKLSGADKIIISKTDYVELPKYFIDNLPFVVFDFNYKIDNIKEIVSFVLNDNEKK